MNQVNLFSITKAFAAVAMVAVVSQMAMNSVQAQDPPNPPASCPSELLFSMGGYYYYGVITCGNNASQPVIFVYEETVDTGCKVDGTCNCVTPLYGVINQTGTFGGDKNAKKPKKFKAVTVDDQLMTPFGKSKISRIGNEKFVKATIVGKVRYFKVYNIRYSEKAYAFGVEVNQDPSATGKTVEDAQFRGFKNNFVKLKVPGFTETVEAMYVK